MSMPEFPTPNPELTVEQALSMILSSIAMEELALSHILNAEGEKIQYMLKRCDTSPSELLAVNKSVTGLMEMVMQNQLLLKSKMDKVLDYLPPPSAPPMPMPKPPMPNREGACFCALACVFRKGEEIKWQACGRHQVAILPSADGQILVEGVCRFEVCFSVDFCTSAAVELLVSSCSKTLYSERFCSEGTTVTGKAVFCLPPTVGRCLVSLIVRSDCPVRVRCGQIKLTSI